MIYILALLIGFSNEIFAQLVGINTTTPTAALDVQGDLILKSLELTLPDGVLYNVDVNTNKVNHYRLIGPTGNFALAGMLAAADDRMVTLYNRTGSSMEIYNDDQTAAPGDRIFTGTNTTMAIYPGGNVTLRYTSIDNRWEVVSSHYDNLDFFGGSWAANANDIYNTNSGNIGLGTNTPLDKLSVVGNVDISGEIKTAGLSGQAGEVLQNNGNGTMSWAQMSESETNDVGYGSFGCDMSNVTEYNPVFTNYPGSSKLGYAADLQGNYAILGAPYTNVFGHLQRGAAYIYVFDGMNWIQQTQIYANDGIANDEFGNAVAIHYPWAVVGAPKADFNGNSNRGAAYVYYFDGTSWVEFQKIIDPNGGVSDNYGWSVSMDDTHILIAAIADNFDTGSVQVFGYDGNQWVLQQNVTPTGGISGDNFGTGVSIDGNRMVVGAESDDNNFSSEGSVYFFEFDGVNWIQQNKFHHLAPVANLRFGKSVGISGDQAIVGSALDKVQFFQLFNGQWQYNSGFSGIGSSFVDISDGVGISTAGKLYKATPQSWFILETVTDPEGTAGGAIFSSCAIDNDRFVIGAPNALDFSGMAIFGKVK